MPEPTARQHLPLTPLSFEILLSLADGPRHGYGIITEAEARSGEPFPSSTGTLYLAIQRLRKGGLVAVAAAGANEGGNRGPRGRAYELTQLGRRVAMAEAERLAARVRDARNKSLLDAPHPERTRG